MLIRDLPSDKIIPRLEMTANSDKCKVPSENLGSGPCTPPMTLCIVAYDDNLDGERVGMGVF